MRPNASILGALVALALTAPARAADRITFPYAGVTHVHRVVLGLDAHVVTVDLAASLDVVSTRPHDRWATVSTWARENRAQIAINANFFAGSVCGLATGDGRVWGDAYAEQCDATMAFGRSASGWRGAVIDSAGWVRVSPIPWAEQVVTGMPILLQDGYTFFDEHEPNGMYRTHPRTAIGLGGDGSTLILVEIEGRRAGIPGVTSLEMIPLLEEFGARDAINLDGGGSSALWIEAEGG
ncbi:MAG: phosphodiester glycosidase family protein, partial [Deltaproteobacteria bacterium]